MSWSNKWTDNVLFNEAVETVEVILNIARKDSWPKQVKAMRFGDLAVHDDVMVPSLLQVTHVPTLARFDAAVPLKDWNNLTSDQLLEWCRKVQQNHLEEWSKLRALTPNNWQTEEAEAKVAIQEWCLSVPVS